MNNHHWPILFLKPWQFISIVFGCTMVVMAHDTMALGAMASPQWQILDQGEIHPQPLKEIGNNSDPNPLGSLQTPLLLTQGESSTEPPAEITPNFVPLHRRRGGDAFVPSLLPLTPPPGEERDDQKKRTSSPGTSIMIPSAYGSSWGAVGIGLGGQERVRFSTKRDGTMGVSLALGDPQKNVGLQLGLGLTNLSNILDRGNLSWKFHRQIDPNDHIAIGGTNLFNWGGGDGGSSGYGVYTHRFDLKDDPSQTLGQLTLSLGLGGGQFRKEDDIRAGEDYLSFFGGAALKVAAPVNAIVEWTGQDLTLGLSIAPFPQVPIVITPAITDITGTAGDGTRFIFGLGYSFSL